MAKAKRTTLAMFAALALALLSLGGVASAQQEGTSLSSPGAPTDGPNQRLVVEKPSSPTQGTMSDAQKQIKAQGYLVPDQQAYEEAKARATREAATKQATKAAAQAAAPAPPPQAFRSWEGIRDRRVTPSDSTGAIGPSRYVELVNLKYAIYDRASDNPLAEGRLRDLVGVKHDFSLSDPQIIWDATTGRFYYVVLEFANANDNHLMFGFSKTASPNSPADFCKYSVRYGSRLPDYPKLGDTEGLLLIGANSFEPVRQGYRYVGSDLVSITKPADGTTCPGRKTFAVDAQQNLKGADGLRAWTPVPTNQIDSRGAGHVVAVSNAIYRNGRANLLNIYRVSENRNGSMHLSSSRGLDVPSYRFPAYAPQPNNNNVIDTMDTRNTQAVEAFDPSPGEMALWTQQTVFGSSGAQVRWYEIDPSFPFPSVLQRGSLGDLEGNYYFNAAISPDREVNDTTSRFGDAMVMGYNTSSKDHPPDIRMVSKVGSEPLSEQTLVKSSPLSMSGHSCDLGDLTVCRWGDYSAATPDPLVPGDPSTGRVWLTNQWVKFPGGTEPSQHGWGTWNWAATQ